MKIKQSGKVGLAQAEMVLTRLVNELYKAGLNVYRIAKLLSIPSTKVYEILPDGVSAYPPGKNIDEDNPLVQKILYDFDVPIATDVLIENEKERYTEYSRLEKTALRIMNSVLEYYSQQFPTGDFREDREIARMASEFIKVTHSARQELIAKYAIDKKVESNAELNKVKVEFVNGNDS